MNQAGFTLRGRNPDVLTCIANLSNDEVFTPPELRLNSCVHPIKSISSRQGVSQGYCQRQ
ncbi:MAG: hypothetical protein WCK93_08510 [Nitrosomonadales bacterium]